jgi:hypothetical protein
MGYLDDLLGKTVMLNGVTLPDRKIVNFVAGDDVQIYDNPALLATNIAIQGGSFARAFSNIILAVDTLDGSDTSTVRPTIISGGDWTAYPFLTIQAALSSLPAVLGAFAAQIDMVVGAFSITISDTITHGITRPLPTTNLLTNDLSAGAYAEITAHAAGGQTNATIIGLQLTKVKTASADHASIRFPSAADLPGIGFGAHGRIKNRTASIVDLYPPADGSTIISGNSLLGAGIPHSIAAGVSVEWFVEADTPSALQNPGNWNVD